ncbi:UvrD-helicase domain-containing protein [bacterium]|nr:UvrD-helicase domain-containing protein [bacterium]
MNHQLLTEKQREAVHWGKGPLMIVAGAGTGKTLVITHRIAHLIESKMARPEEILALTFTEKAAAEMSERVDVLLPYGFAHVEISTFHAFGDRILREFALDLGMNPDFQVLSQAEQIIFFREHLFEFPLRHYRPLSDPVRFIQAMLNVISRAKDENVTPEDYERFVQGLKADQDPGSGPVHSEMLEKQEEIAGTYRLYQSFMLKEGKVDFGDQVMLCIRLLQEHAAVLTKVQERYRFILVDEFQDTNFAQFQLVQLIGGPDANITVVGDDDQSIYKFRGAAISNILSFMEIYPHAGQVVLTENFRSTQRILDTAYRLITHNNPDRLEVRNQIDKHLTALETGEFPVEHLHCDTLTTESDRVARIIRDAVDQKNAVFSDFAILVRSNNDADSFLRALNVMEIPWRFTGNRGLYSRPEVRLLISFFRVIADPQDSVSLYHLASSELYELGSMEDLNLCLSLAHRRNQHLFQLIKKLDTDDELKDLTPDSVITLKKIIGDIQRYREEARNHITGNVLYQFITESGYLKRLTQHESAENNLKIRNIANFFDVIWAFAQVAKDDRIVHFVPYLDLLMEAGDDPGQAEADPDLDAVNVLTVHKAKGLEWPVVFMVSLLHNKFPHTRRKDPIELPECLTREILPEGDFHIQEERRLFYVGMTRAKRRLYLTSAADYGGVRQRKPSQFILEALDRPRIDEVNVKSCAEERIRRFAPVESDPVDNMMPIPESSVLNLSHYQADDYMTCPLKYKYVHVLRLPFFHHTIVYGKAVHAAVELYFQHKIKNMPVNPEQLFKAYADAWKNIGFLSREHEERRFEAGKEAIRNFFEREQNNPVVPEFVEEPFSFMLGANRISGRWDRIDVDGDAIVIIDFKTSEVYQQDQADKKAKDSLQLTLYAMAYESICGCRPTRLELHFLASGLIGRSEVTDKMFEKAEEKIQKAAAGIRKRDYTAAPSYTACQYCAYSNICPSAVK